MPNTKRTIKELNFSITHVQWILSDLDISKNEKNYVYIAFKILFFSAFLCKYNWGKSVYKTCKKFSTKTPAGVTEFMKISKQFHHFIWCSLPIIPFYVFLFSKRKLKKSFLCFLLILLAFFLRPFYQMPLKIEIARRKKGRFRALNDVLNFHGIVKIGKVFKNQNYWVFERSKFMREFWIRNFNFEEFNWINLNWNLIKEDSTKITFVSCYSISLGSNPRI